jgi:hypothetical protein
MGGELANGSRDDAVWALHVGGSVFWAQLTNAPLAVGRSGHSLIFTADVLPHEPEIYDLSTSSRTTMGSSNLLQEEYPQMFLLPDGRLFDAGPNLSFYSWSVNPTGGAWSRTPNTFISTLFGSAVMYEPGKVMRAGGTGHGSFTHGTTQAIDLNGASPQWQNGANAMLSRDDHNLVLLPNGRVMVLGGLGGSGFVREPQIWNPSSAQWSPPGTHALDPEGRDYHSTAILLPDGRILSAGSNNNDRATIYCPPYLYKTDGSVAARPQVSGGPARTTWGADFHLCVSNPSSVQRVSLLRAPSTTHGFDQNQRYVPLEFTTTPTGLRVVVPSNPNVAPPGAYMLFVVGSPDGADVPSVARWLQIDAATPDLCDYLPGAPLNLEIDMVGTTTMDVWWNANADDGTDAISGASSEYDFRRAFGPIDSETAWSSASHVLDEPTPATAGTIETHQITGLTPCTTYHLAARTRDDMANLSPFHAAAYGTTVGFGCSGLIAQPGSALSSMRSHGAATTDGDVSATIAGALLVKTTRMAGGGWRFDIRRVEDVAEVAGVTSTREVEIQDASGNAWTTGRAFDASADDHLLGLCRVSDGGRTVLKGFDVVDIASGFRTREGAFALKQGIEEAHPLSESLMLEFEPVATEERGQFGNWYILVARSEGMLAGAPGPDPVSSTVAGTTSFALRQNQPNPFEGTTRIAFELPVSSNVLLEIFDLLGRRVRTLTSGSRSAGHYSVDWDQRDDLGQRVRPGVYHYSLVAGDFRQRKSMVVLK